MSAIFSLTLRNLKLFIRDKSLVFFSFLSVIIILGLYVLFLGEIQVSNIESQIGFVNGIDALVYAWMLPGVIGVASLTLSLGNMGRLVDDTQTKTLLDFLVAPIKRSQLILSYMFSSIIIASFISILMFVASIFIVKWKGGPYLDFNQIVESLAIMALLILSSSLLSLIIASYVKTQNTYSVINTIVGTFIGFVTGAYMPMGIMPIFVQNMFNVLPISMGASLLRQVFLKNVISEVFANAPSEVILNYRYFQGIDLKVYGHILEPNLMYTALIISTILLFVFTLYRFSKLNKRT